MAPGRQAEKLERKLDGRFYYETISPQMLTIHHIPPWPVSRNTECYSVSPVLCPGVGEETSDHGPLPLKHCQALGHQGAHMAGIKSIQSSWWEISCRMISASGLKCLSLVIIH